jgi:hypothetical protein
MLCLFVSLIGGGVEWDDIPTLVLSLADDSTKPAFNFFAKACPSAVVTLLFHQLIQPKSWGDIPLSTKIRLLTDNDHWHTSHPGVI